MSHQAKCRCAPRIHAPTPRAGVGSRIGRWGVALAVACTVLGACDSTDKPKRADLKPATPDAPAKAEATPAPAGKVMFIKPADGATVGTRVEVEMGVVGKTVKPAGDTVRDPLTGHHHIIIDGGPIKDLTIVPKDEKNLHYGDGATKTTLLLTPGEHKLTMQFGDGAHRSFGPDWASTITVKVVEGAGDPAKAE